MPILTIGRNDSKRFDHKTGASGRLAEASGVRRQASGVRRQASGVRRRAGPRNTECDCGLCF
ncbi:hypothetical protein EHJ03_12405 [Cronobacter dublinensis]|nr:hypothetical protein [Cronobacter dublinensis]